MDNSPIIERIEVQLKEMRMKKLRFYELLGITPSAFSQWKSNKTEPTSENLESAARILGLPVAYLRYGISDEKESPSTGETDEERELNEYLEMLRTRPECRILLSTADGATKAEVEANVKIIEALRGYKRDENAD